MKRGQWYATNHGGGLRTARKEFVCGQSMCLRKIQPGEQYFDTCMVTTWPKTKRICTCCAEEELK